MMFNQRMTQHRKRYAIQRSVMIYWKGVGRRNRLKRFLFTALLFAAAFSASLLADDFLLIQSGTFLMGSPLNEPERDRNELQRRVTLSAFYMGKYEVTQREWYDVMGTTVQQQREKAGGLRLFGEGDNYPMYYVSWLEAVEYCNKRSQKEGLSPAYTIDGKDVIWDRSANGYRLPTEAEWEYACRAGTTTPFSTGDNITATQANFNGSRPYNKNPESEFRKTTIRVGNFAPNAFGLYDMHGNVGEWCWDWHKEYAEGDQIDPSGADFAPYRVFRGSGWTHDAKFTRSARRGGNKPSSREDFVGFRLARNAE